ncbi:MAG: phosphate ABC transporter ATP-binding protein PstB [Cytophagales bacterium]|nr:phosphate ABC transporter ATP-binding protein PstB [Bernardetiaceae bacterium]MDW8211424.1 phosphate ABC transporter ATP-binding protein PstB [Cytophagales bacterium]
MTSTATSIAIDVQQWSLSFGQRHVLKEISMRIPVKKVTALIGPSGCGKSTLLRSFNRMHELNNEVTYQGSIKIDDKDIFQWEVTALRRQVGMIFQKPVPFPKSIYDNIAYGLKINGFPEKEIPQRIEEALTKSYLWNEVKDKLREPATRLSGGQQQRLCIARTIALQPEIVLMDEPCSALDPISTAKIEELIKELAQNYTIVLVTHNMQQAMRVADYTAFMYLGELIEMDTTEQIFHYPKQELTRNYVQGNFG